jgi:hypothetical protein
MSHKNCFLHIYPRRGYWTNSCYYFITLLLFIYLFALFLGSQRTLEAAILSLASTLSFSSPNSASIIKDHKDDQIVEIVESEDTVQQFRQLQSNLTGFHIIYAISIVTVFVTLVRFLL